MRRPIILIRGRDNQRVEGILCNATQKHKDDFNSRWKAQLQDFGTEDQDWDWEFKERVYSFLPGAEKYALECNERTQGLMLIATQGNRSWIAPAESIVYVRYIASAPWNRPEIQSPPAFKGTGRNLLLFARQRSLELGYGGRVGLHSLTGAEAFYDKVGMPNYGPDREREDLVYFEWGHLRP